MSQDTGYCMHADDVLAVQTELELQVDEAASLKLQLTQVGPRWIPPDAAESH